MVTIVDGVQRSEFVPLDESWLPLEVKIRVPEGAQIGLDQRYLPFPLINDGKTKTYAHVHFNFTGSFYHYRSSKTHEILKNHFLQSNLPGWSTANDLAKWTVEQLRKGQFGFFIPDDDSGIIPVDDVNDWEYRRADVLIVNKIGSQLKCGDIVKFSGQRDKRSARLIDSFNQDSITSRKVMQDPQDKNRWILTGHSSVNGLLTATHKWVDGKWIKIDIKD